MEKLKLIIIILFLNFKINDGLDVECVILEKGFYHLEGKYTECGVRFMPINSRDVTINKINKKASQPQVQILDIEDENVHYLPIDLHKKFPNLIAYEASGCSLQEVTGENFKGMYKLKVLNVAHNRIQYIAPGTFNDVENLEYLSLAGNKLQYVGSNVLNLPNLKTLYLESNELESISSETFEHTKSLEILVLKNNKISKLATGAFDNLVNLNQLSISNNKIHTINSGLFKNNVNLEYVWLNDNDVEVIDSGAFDNLKKLKHIEMNAAKCIDMNSQSIRVEKLKSSIKNCASDEAKKTETANQNFQEMRKTNFNIKNEMSVLNRTFETFKQKTIKRVKDFQMKYNETLNELKQKKYEVDRLNKEFNDWKDEKAFLEKEVHTLKSQLNLCRNSKRDNAQCQNCISELVEAQDELRVVSLNNTMMARECKNVQLNFNLKLKEKIEEIKTCTQEIKEAEVSKEKCEKNIQIVEKESKKCSEQKNTTQTDLSIYQKTCATNIVKLDFILRKKNDGVDGLKEQLRMSQIIIDDLKTECKINQTLIEGKLELTQSQLITSDELRAKFESDLIECASSHLTTMSNLQYCRNQLEQCQNSDECDEKIKIVERELKNISSINNYLQKEHKNIILEFQLKKRELKECVTEKDDHIEAVQECYVECNQTVSSIETASLQRCETSDKCSEELKTLKIDLINKNTTILNLVKDNNEWQNQFDKKHNDFINCNNQLVEQQNNNDVCFSECNATTIILKEHNSESEKIIEVLQSQMKKCSKESADIDSNFTASIKNCEKTVVSISSILQTQNQTIKNQVELVNDLQDIIDDLQTSCKVNQTTNNQIIFNLQSQKADCDSGNSILQDDIIQLTIDKDKYKNNLDSCHDLNKSLKNSTAAAKFDLKTCSDTVGSIQKELEATANDIKDLRDTLKDKNVDINNQISKINKLEQINRDYKSDCDDKLQPLRHEAMLKDAQLEACKHNSSFASICNNNKLINITTINRALSRENNKLQTDFEQMKQELTICKQNEGGCKNDQEKLKSECNINITNQRIEYKKNTEVLRLSNDQCLVQLTGVKSNLEAYRNEYVETKSSMSLVIETQRNTIQSQLDQISNCKKSNEGLQNDCSINHSLDSESKKLATHLATCNDGKDKLNDKLLELTVVSNEQLNSLEFCLNVNRNLNNYTDLAMLNSQICAGTVTSLSKKLSNCNKNIQNQEDKLLEAVAKISNLEINKMNCGRNPTNCNNLLKDKLEAQSQSLIDVSKQLKVLNNNLDDCDSKFSELRNENSNLQNILNTAQTNSMNCQENLKISQTNIRNINSSYSANANRFESAIQTMNSNIQNLEVQLRQCKSSTSCGNGENKISELKNKLNSCNYNLKTKIDLIAGIESNPIPFCKEHFSVSIFCNYPQVIDLLKQAGYEIENEQDLLNILELMVGNPAEADYPEAYKSKPSKAYTKS